MLTLLKNFIILCVLIPCFVSLRYFPADQSTIKKLRSFLLQGYDVNARPVTNYSRSTMVQVDLMPVHITDVNENRGILTLEAWVYMGWQDEHLKWEPKNYDGMNELQLSEKEVWKPDIAVWEGRGSKISPWQGSTLEVNNSGYVIWVPAATLQTYCGYFDYQHYPHDTQTCYVTLGPWSHDVTTINVTLRKNASLQEFSFQNPHWDLVGMKSVREELEEHEGTTGEKYATVEYELTLERTHVPSAFLDTVPIAVARVLVLGMFWLTNPTRKFLLGCTSLIILAAVAVGIGVTLPSSALAPAALYRVSCSMALCVTAIVVEILATCLSDCNLALPSVVEKASGSRPVRALTLCQLPHRSAKEDCQEIVESERIAPNAWPVLAVLLDRVAFIVFAVLLIAL